jgi:Tfp pilus assembly protein PilO
MMRKLMMLKDKLIKSSQSSKIIVSVTIVAIVSVAAYNWAVSPLTTYLNAAQLHETVMGNAQERAEEVKIQIHTKQAELEKMEKEISDVQSGFFTVTRAKEFFLDLEPISAETGCDVELFEFVSENNGRRSKDKVDNGHGITAKSAEISFTGGYENIINFLKRLGSCPERFSINQIVMEPVGDNQFTQLKCRMMVTIYMIQDKEICKRRSKSVPPGGRLKIVPL